MQNINIENSLNDLIKKVEYTIREVEYVRVSKNTNTNFDCEFVLRASTENPRNEDRFGGEVASVVQSMFKMDDYTVSITPGDEGDCFNVSVYFNL